MVRRRRARQEERHPRGVDWRGCRTASLLSPRRWPGTCPVTDVAVGGWRPGRRRCRSAGRRPAPAHPDDCDGWPHRSSPTPSSVGRPGSTTCCSTPTDGRPPGPGPERWPRRRDVGAWSEDPREALRAGPDFDLDAMDRGATPGWEDDKKAAKQFGDAARQAAERAAGAAVRRGPGGRGPSAAGHRPGPRHRREGWRRPARPEQGRPPGRGPAVVRATDRGGAEAPLPVADPQGAARPRPHRGLRPVALRGRADRAGRRAGATRDLGGPLRRDQPVRERPRRGGHDRLEVRDDGQPRRAGRATHEAPGPPRQALEVQRQRPPDPAPVGRLPGGVRRRVPSHLHRRGAVVRRPGRPQVVRPSGHHRDPDPDPDRPWTPSGPRSVGTRWSSGASSPGP